MADFDVGITALSSPPQPAYVASYRPAVSVKNYGIHEAYAAGTLRIYTAGQLIFSTTILSGLIQPGDTKDALALDYWTPTAPGTYMCIAHVDTDHDQNLSNNDLAPVTFSVSGLPPPPPPGVTPHAAQHEEHAADEIDLDGMRGKLRDQQDPSEHKTSHQVGGSDQLDVTGLPGQLLEGQAIADHHATHEGDGDDELNVDNLHGVLYNKQKPQTHANEAHDPNFSANPHGASDHNTSVEATANKGKAEGYAGLDEDALVHPANLGGDPSGLTGEHLLAIDVEATPMLSWQPTAALEHTANKGEAGGYAELDEFAHVPADQLGALDASPPEPQTEVLHRDQTWRNPAPAEPTAHHETHEPGGSDVLSGIAPLAHHESHEDGGDDELSIAGLPGKAADAQTPVAHGLSHESGESDEMDVGGLLGTLHDPQPPAAHDSSVHDSTVEATANKGAANGYCELDGDAKVPVTRIPAGSVAAHAANHEAGGEDQVSIEGLSGKAADAQTPTAHHSSHEPRGDDQLSISGLSGKAADAQTPETHAPTHDKDSTDALSTGNPIATQPGEHSSAGTATTYVRKDHHHRSPGGFAATKAHKHITSATEEVILSASVHSGLLSPRSVLRSTVHGQLWVGPLGQGLFRFRVRFGPNGENPEMNQLFHEVAVGVKKGVGINRYGFKFEAIFNCWTSGGSSGTGEVASTALIHNLGGPENDYPVVILPPVDVESFDPSIYNYLVISAYAMIEGDNGMYAEIAYAEDVFMGEDAGLEIPE